MAKWNFDLPDPDEVEQGIRFDDGSLEDLWSGHPVFRDADHRFSLYDNQSGVLREFAEA